MKLTPAQKRVLKTLENGPVKPAPDNLYPLGMHPATVDSLERLGMVAVERIRINAATSVRALYSITDAGRAALAV